LDNRFPKSARILKPKDYQRAYKTGKRYSGQLLQVYYCSNQLAECRFGISVGRRFGKAVERNLLKRRIREGIRQIKAYWPLGWDVVIHPKTSAGAVPNIGAIVIELKIVLKSISAKRNWNS
jgi:ribonuclease P protein component